MQVRVEAVVELLATGDTTGGTRLFLETVAFGPGVWEQMSTEEQERLIANAPTFVDETRDPAALTIDLSALATFARPTLLSYGDQSPPFFPPVITKLARVMPLAEVRRFAGADHIVIGSHPAEYVEAVTALAATADAAGGT